MAGFDPTAAIALDAAALFAQYASDTALSIEAQTQAFIATIAVGDVIPAEVLPAQNGADRLQLFGQTINAQLPPGIHPGEEILLQVTSLQGQQIVVRNLGPIDSDAARAAIAQAQARGPAPQAAPQAPPLLPSSSVNRVPVAPRLPQTPADASLAPAPLRGRIDPGVYTSTQFAQATPGRTAPASIPVTPIQPEPSLPPQAQAAAPPASSGVATPPASGETAPPTSGAVIAPPREVFVAASVQLPNGQRLLAPQRPTADATPATPVPSQLPTEASVPNEAPLRGVPDSRVELIRQAVEAARRPATAPVDRGAFGAPRVTAAQLKEFAPEAALLARLRVPVSLQTLTAARAASGAAAALPAAFQRLETLLAKVANPDPRIATLRSLLPFIGKIDLANVRALPQQLSSYVSHVLEGTEGKIADIVRLLSMPPGAADASSASAASLPANSTPLAQADVLVQAKAAEREAALAQSLKAVIASVAGSSSGSPQLSQALGDTLRAVTAVQLQALAQQDSDPKTLVVPLPVQYYEGGRPAELRVSKDAPNGGRIDPENFSISFVLDTKTMGTIGIDVQTVGRTVNVNVRTERTHAADRFKSTFEDLRGRLAQLRYRVAGMRAEMLVRDSGATNAPPTPVVERPRNGSKEWQA